VYEGINIKYVKEWQNLLLCQHWKIPRRNTLWRRESWGSTNSQLSTGNEEIPFFLQEGNKASKGDGQFG
jgi:hypothetical protein